MGVRMLKVAAAAMVLAATSACAGLVTPVDPYAPLKMAFTTPVETLRAQSDQSAEAAWALHFLTLHGLRGVKADATEAARLRAASGPRQTMITQYTPAFNGAPSRVNVIPIQVGGVVNGDMLLACGRAMLLPPAQRDAPGRRFCGTEAWAQLAPLASASSTPRP